MSDVWRNTGWVLNAEKRKSTPKKDKRNKRFSVKSVSSKSGNAAKLDASIAWQTYRELQNERICQQSIKKKEEIT